MVGTLIEILVVVLICYVAWGLIFAAIMRRMRAELPEYENVYLPIMDDPELGPKLGW